MSSQTPAGILRKLDERDGHRDAWTGEESERLVPQHRVGGMGGSPFKHRMSNVVWLDSIRNGLIESDPEMQREAVRRGIKVSKFSDPSEVPVEHAVHGLVYLDDEGGFRPADRRTEPGAEVPSDPWAGWREA